MIEFTCPKCGHERYRDVPIHNGQSTRRDCAYCARTIGFPSWFGQPRADWNDSAAKLFPGGQSAIEPTRLNHAS